MRVRTSLVLCWLAGVCLLSAGVFAAPADNKRSELSALRDKIRGLQDEMARSEETHEETADELASSGKAISAAQRRLREISQQREQAEAEVLRLQARQQALENELAMLRKQLGDAIFRLYVEGGQSGARRFLSGDSPNQLSRDAYYLEQIARQRLQAIDRARAASLALQTLLSEAQAQRAGLQHLEKQQREEQQTLLSERRKQREVLNRLSTQLRDQRKQILSLQRNEARMEKLLRGLERIARSAPSKKPEPAASRPLVAAEKSEPVTARAETVVREGQDESAFASRKGMLAWPVSGLVKGRFGSPRAEGGANWRGVFIKAPNAAEVRAVAAGKVAFADWLRGFGNLVIVDHGAGYMTVYGNNEALFKSPGDDVRAGEVLASVGSSGGLEESGLYFEIRLRGQPQDPARWMAAK